MIRHYVRYLGNLRETEVFLYNNCCIQEDFLACCVITNHLANSQLPNTGNTNIGGENPLECSKSCIKLFLCYAPFRLGAR